jgi:hypothetical protein
MDCVYQSQAHLSTKNWTVCELMFFNKERDSRLAIIYGMNPKIAGARLRAKFHELRKKAENELGVNGGSIGNLSAKAIERPKWSNRLKLIFDDMERVRVNKDSVKDKTSKRRIDMEHINRVTLGAGTLSNSVLSSSSTDVRLPIETSNDDEISRKRPKLGVLDIKVIIYLLIYI